MKVITAPQEIPDHAELFLAGGISNCPDWQQEMIELLETTPGVLLNPRRSGVLIPEEAVNQITWEVNAFTHVNVVSFWFPSETLCPITLFELGRFANDESIQLFVGVHPDYQRRLDIEVQLGLLRPDVKIVYSVEDLATQVSNFLS